MPALLVLVAANAALWTGTVVVLGNKPALLGLAGLAYGFGLRHAFDADHIAAIDNATRKLAVRGRRAANVGLFFALGHSTVVVLASALVAFAGERVRRTLGRMAGWGGVVGGGASALFLLGIGFANLVLLAATWRSFANAQARHPDRAKGNAFKAAAPAGVVTRLFRPLMSSLSRPSDMYWIGLLFGLGFDTATEVGLIGMTASQAAHHLNPFSILLFPALFTAGMALMDHLDSLLMVKTYRRANNEPQGFSRYNLLVTSLSIASAFVIGGAEALNLIVAHLPAARGLHKLAVGWQAAVQPAGWYLFGTFAAILIGAQLARARRRAPRSDDRNPVQDAGFR